MNLSELRTGELKEVFDALEEAFVATNTDYYVIGAMAKDIWYSHGKKTSRQTKDVDFAVLTGSAHSYEEIKDYLRQIKNFADTRGNSFVMISPSGVQVDILPFGEIEIDYGVTISGGGLDKINVRGFMEVYQSGTKSSEIETGHRFEVATLPAIVLLKFIAYNDRPERRQKDARDIADIIEHFFELQPELVYSEEHLDLYDTDDDKELPDISATIIGREIKKIISSNEELYQSLKQIIRSHFDKGDESAFVRHMVQQVNGTVEKNLRHLANILVGLD